MKPFAADETLQRDPATGKIRKDVARGDYPVGLGEAGDSYCGCIIVTDHEAQLRGAEVEFHA